MQRKIKKAKASWDGLRQGSRSKAGRSGNRGKSRLGNASNVLEVPRIKPRMDSRKHTVALMLNCLHCFIVGGCFERAMRTRALLALAQANGN